MKIEFKEFIIESDSNNFILYRKGVTGEKAEQPGKEYLKVEGYYADIYSLLTAAANKILMASDATTLNQLRAEMAEIKRVIKEAFE